MSNYISGSNPFALAGPPAWWLRKLWDFDNSLVVVPSVQGFHYRLCQRRPLDQKARLVNEVQLDGDSKQLAQHGLIPVTTILATARWDNPLMWIDLAERAPWRNGGAKEYEAKLNDIEHAKNLKIAQQQNEHNTYLSKDAWKMYLKKVGLRQQLWSPTVKKGSTGEAAENRAPLIKIAR